MERALLVLHAIFGIGSPVLYASMVWLLWNKPEEDAANAREKLIAHTARIFLLGAFATGILLLAVHLKSLSTLHYYAAAVPLFLLIGFRLIMSGRQPSYRAYRLLFAVISVSLIVVVVSGLLQ